MNAIAAVTGIALGIIVGYAIGYRDGEDAILSWVKEGVRERDAFSIDRHNRLERRTLRR